MARKYYPFIHSGIRGHNPSGRPPYALLRDSIDLTASLSFAEFTLLGGADPFYRTKQLTLANYGAES